MESKTIAGLTTGLILLCHNACAQHLWWNLEHEQDARCVYGEITVLATQPTTYYCGANWHPGEPAGGYCGIQHNDPGERRTIFSIWDTSPQLHPHTSQADPKTIYSRFGGEGEGAHTHMIWNWQTNETFHFFVSKQSGGDMNTTDVRYYIFDPAAKQWRHMATITCPNGGQSSVGTIGGGLNSFLENFSGTDPSAPRLALYRLWLGPDAGHLKCLTRAVGDGTWGELHDRYFLASGGTNELSAVFASLEPQYGAPVYGGNGAILASVSDQALPEKLIRQLQHLPTAPAVSAAN